MPVTIQNGVQKDDLDVRKGQRLVDNNAQEIFKKLKELENEPKHQRRWIWELLQNAKDTSSDKPVNIEICWDGQDLTFSHNGENFSKDEIIHLIYHGSSKREDEGKTGKYGTGFMTTHLLSKRVKVTGKVRELESFNFTLDRSGNNAEEISLALEQSWEDFKKSLKPRPDKSNEDKTTFTYLNLSPEGAETVHKVISQATSLIPPVLVFVNNIEKIKIDNKGDTVIYERLSFSKSNKVSIVKKQVNGEELVYSYVKRDLVDGKIAIPLNNEDKLIKLGDEIPRFFIGFPLIGTEKVPLPFLVHSQSFEPSSEREKLWLGAKATDESKVNKKILSSAFQEYLLLTDKLLEEDVENRHFLANMGVMPELDWLDKDWYLEQMENLIDELDKRSFVKNCLNEFIPLGNSKVPCSPGRKEDNEAIETWTLASMLKPEKTPEERLSSYWRKVISDRETLSNEVHYAAFTLEDICREIHNLPNKKLDDLRLEELDPLSFICQLVQCLENHKKESLWNENGILPNQAGQLKKAGDLEQENLKDSKRVGEDLKDISHKLGIPIRETLLHPKIEIHSNNHRLRVKSKQEVIAEVLKEVREKKEDQTEEELEGNLELLKWLLQNEQYSVLPGYPVKMLSGKWKTLQQESEHIFLCPPDIWRQNFQPFYELFPDDYILSKQYSYIFKDQEILDKASKQKWVLKDPLYIKDDKLKEDEIFKIATKKEGKELLTKSEDEEWQMVESISFSQIAFLNFPQDKSVIDLARGAKKRTSQLLEFIVEGLLKEDRYGFESKSIRIENDSENQESIEIYPSRWLLELKSRKWVKAQTGNKGEQPAVESLSPYFQDKDLSSALRRNEVFRFLHFLGLEVGGLLRNLRTGDEEERIAWDQSYVSILMNDKLTPQKISNILSDEDFIKEYDEKKKQKEKMEENQIVGKAVEKAFVEAFESVEGYSIKREPIGSDYEIECDYLHKLLLNSKNKENFLVEIKSARTSEVRMTITQGATACQEGANYILCVVPLNDGAITADAILNESRFVTNISKLLKERVKNVDKIINLKDIEVQSSNLDSESVRTEIDGTKVRYVIQQRVWEAERPEVLSFDEFINGVFK
ncbi:MAG TPA: hypothetical protein VF181_02855 [Balneolaceae bacterium]